MSSEWAKTALQSGFRGFIEEKDRSPVKTGRVSNKVDTPVGKDPVLYESIRNTRHGMFYKYRKPYLSPENLMKGRNKNGS